MLSTDADVLRASADDSSKPSSPRGQARLRVLVGQQHQLTRRAPVLEERQFFFCLREIN